MTNIVMLGRNRLTLTKQAIESLYANTPGDNWTLTYVDDSSDDFRVSKYLRSINRKNFSLLEVTSGSSHVLSQLKNLGAYWSEQRWGRGDWLYFSDNDVFFSKDIGSDWLTALTGVAMTTEPEGFRLWGGQIHPFHQPINASVSHPDNPCEWTEHSILDGPSWLMRWPTWDLYGPFPRTTAPGACQSEEYPFCQRLTMPVAPHPKHWKYIDENIGVTTLGGGRIGVIHPHVVIHTGLSQTDGKPAPGYAERLKTIPPGVLAE